MQEASAPLKAQPPADEHFTRETLAKTFRGEASRYEFTGDHLAFLLTSLHVSEAQANAAQAYFAKYKQQLDERWFALADEVRGPFLELVNGTNGGNIEQMDEFGRTRAAEKMKKIATAMDKAREDSDAARDRFIGDVTSILTEEQAALLPVNLRHLRRNVLLQPENPRGMHFDLDILPDVVSLFEEATRKDDGEFSQLDNPQADDDGDALQFVELKRSIESTLKQYELELDELLQQSHRQDWDMRVKLILARILKDESDARNANRSRLHIWRRIYELTDRTMNSIAQAVEPLLGVEVREAWLSRYHKRTFPELLAPETPELIIEWLREQTIDEDVLASVEQSYLEYLMARQPLRNEAKRVMVERRMKRDPLRPGAEPYSLEMRIPEELQNTEQRRAELARKTTNWWRGLLSPDLQESFDEQLKEILEQPYARAHALLRF